MRAHLHEGILLHGRQPTHVHPRGRLTFAEIVSLALDAPETDSSESMYFQAVLLAFFRCNDVDVRLFACPDLIPNGVKAVSLCECSHSQKVVATVCEPVAIV